MKNGMAPVYIPDGTEEEESDSPHDASGDLGASGRHRVHCIRAIAECFGKQDKWFGGVVVTDGRGSPRSGLYADYTDEEMKSVRITEQKKGGGGGYTYIY